MTGNLHESNKTNDRVVFCTECQEELDDLALSEDGDDVQKARERFERCRKLGKFKGDFCSRLFITRGDEDEDAFLDLEED